MTDLEKLYLKSKKSYYTGTSSLSDDEFDRLEAELKALNSSVVNLVGFNDMNRNAKFIHPSSMLSLAKHQATIDGIPPIEATLKWMNNLNQDYFEATPKFDGNAVNVIYKNGKLDAILSRGDGTSGRDYTNKLYNSVPSEINSNGFNIIEIRGEVTIKTSIFEAKYSEFKNERNFVAGVLNRDDNKKSVLDDLIFMAIEIRGHKSKGDYDFIDIEILKEWGFNKSVELLKVIFKASEFEDVYNKMLDYRINKSPVRLDGFVIKTKENTRVSIGENGHDPKWAVAIKFPPQEAVTQIIDIQWNYGKTGAYTPIAIMNPINLDGSIVTRASLFNYGYIRDNKCYPGAIVSIAKSGDIIPIIQNIVSPSTSTEVFHPVHCLHCGKELIIDNNIHLICNNENCEGKLLYKFEYAFNQLEIIGSGIAMIKSIWNSGIRNVIDILDKTKFNKDILLSNGQFKEGKILENLLNEVSKIKEIHLDKLILLLGFDGMGKTTSLEVAKFISGQKYSFHSLEKKVVNGFNIGDEKRNLVDEALEILKLNNINIIYPIVVDKSIKIVELTGSPKTAGFKSKSEFIEFLKTKGYINGKLDKNTSYLITDDLNSTSSKMKRAEKNGVKIITYENFIKL